MVLERDQVSIFHTLRDPVNEMAELATERERQFTTARANQTNGLTNGRAAIGHRKSRLALFARFFRRQLTFPFCC